VAFRAAPVLDAMKALLRIIAAWTGLSVVVTLLLLAHLVGGRRSASTSLILLALAATVPLGGYAAVELWRLRHRGRYATIALVAFWGLMTLVSILVGKSPSGSEALRLAVALALGGVLLLPAARRSCR
jgi:hypothetical protein